MSSDGCQIEIPFQSTVRLHDETGTTNRKPGFAYARLSYFPTSGVSEALYLIKPPLAGEVTVTVGGV